MIELWPKGRVVLQVGEKVEVRVVGMLVRAMR